MRLGSLAASIMALGVATVFYLMPETANPQLASVTSVSGDSRLLVAGEEQVLRAGQLIPYEATIITGTSMPTVPS